jgi:hypothetical protein
VLQKVVLKKPRHQNEPRWKFFKNKATRVRHNVDSINTPSNFNHNTFLELNIDNRLSLEINHDEISENSSNFQSSIYRSSSSDDDLEYAGNNCTKTLKALAPFELETDLRHWALKHSVNGIALSDLLDTLKSYKSLEFLPSDHRTLLKPTVHFSPKQLGDGNYCHFSLINHLKKQIDMGFLKSLADTFITIELSFDGLPISGSNNNQFWPIQAVTKAPLAFLWWVYILGNPSLPILKNIYMI